MRKLLLNGAAMLVLATSASAADLASRAPAYSKAPLVTPLTNWSGFYAGVMGGYGWSNDSGGNNFKGGFGGGTLGYNWQTASLLFGLEVDAAAAGIKSSAAVPGLAVSDNIRGLGSVTGRVGFVADSALIYAKGGYAWANNKLDITVAGLNFSDSKIHSGWTLGGGVEYMFVPKWSVKAEYMYADFANANYFSSVVAGGIDSGRQRLHTVKGGVNYHF